MDNISLPKTIEVTSYSGYKANERPLYLIVDNKRIEVQKVIDRWIGEEHDFFRVLAIDGKVYLISWQRKRDMWSIEKIFA